ncbi:hypothetical protein VTL71DRAFT_699 [Oculimacula yallundae]|uniref:Uncharacterized protein n=1 Tax=Oculimacula yallundae TaxID=86028 RepID=A0ABR4D1X0_9HELO
MLRNCFTLFLALPSALALSLSNFQEITSVTIPAGCLLSYDTKMIECKKRDFNKGCSDGCVQNLLSIQAYVQEVCSTIQVSPSTLLGIVKNGGIVNALCPGFGPVVTSSIPATTAPPKTTSTPTPFTSARTSQTVISVSIISSSIVFSTSSSTSASATSTFTPSSSTVSSTTSSVETPQTTATTVSSTTTPEALPVTTTPTNRAGAAASSSSKPKATPKADPGSGGGSPFDISSNGSAGIVRCNSILGVGLVLGWAGYFLGR